MKSPTKEPARGEDNTGGRERKEAGGRREKYTKFSCVKNKTCVFLNRVKETEVDG